MLWHLPKLAHSTSLHYQERLRREVSDRFACLARVSAALRRWDARAAARSTDVLRLLPHAEGREAARTARAARRERGMVLGGGGGGGHGSGPSPYQWSAGRTRPPTSPSTAAADRERVAAARRAMAWDQWRALRRWRRRRRQRAGARAVGSRLATVVHNYRVGGGADRPRAAAAVRAWRGAVRAQGELGLAAVHAEWRSCAAAFSAWRMRTQLRCVPLHLLPPSPFVRAYPPHSPHAPPSPLLSTTPLPPSSRCAHSPLTRGLRLSRAGLSQLRWRVPRDGRLTAGVRRFL